MGYYPTPPKVVDTLRCYLAFPDTTFYALDPCCGEGLALEQLIAGTNGQTYGVELDASRAEEARSRLTQVLHDAWETSVVQHEAFSICLCNPPYDYDLKEDIFAKAKRKELLWIKDMHKYLMPGGILIYIIQQERYSPSICRVLATHYEQIRVCRFLDEEYKAFKQTVLIGIRKETPARNPKTEQALLQIPKKQLEPLLPPSAPLYAVPPAKSELRIFRPRVIRPKDVDRETAYSPLYDRVKEVMRSGVVEINREQPPMPLNPAHKAIFLVAGCMNGAVGKGADIHLLKGTERVEVETETEETPDGQIVEISRESRVPQLVAVEPAGNILDLM